MSRVTFFAWNRSNDREERRDGEGMALKIRRERCRFGDFELMNSPNKMEKNLKREP